VRRLHSLRADFVLAPLSPDGAAALLRSLRFVEPGDVVTGWMLPALADGG
jgi:hypothetical protein